MPQTDPRFTGGVLTLNDDSHYLRLDNTGAGVIKVNTLSHGNYKTDNVDLYIK